MTSTPLVSALSLSGFQPVTMTSSLGPPTTVVWHVRQYVCYGIHGVLGLSVSQTRRTGRSVSLIVDSVDMGEPGPQGQCRFGNVAVYTG